MNAAISHFLAPSNVSALHSRGVRYFVPVEGIDAFWGAMNTVKEGRHYRKHIIVRRAPEHNGLLQLYTYHFPTHWSAACVANRELIKEAQRQAHALEHDHSIEALEWRVRFFNHYFTVFKGGAKPEPGMKPYARFYQYTYVAIYRQLQSERQKAQEGINLEDLNFEAIDMDRPFVLKRRAAMANTNTLKILQINLHIPKKSSNFATQNCTNGEVIT
ncbi:MAG: hypothetical protein J6T71_05670 [Paludibacteraceae bacterium]|nr:hypothetical protein [Paludibacteraceae bacterium]